MRFAPRLFATLSMFLIASPSIAQWQSIEPVGFPSHQDDDIDRNLNTAGVFDGIKVSQLRFSENGFDWHLFRFASETKPDGPLWVVPHDDENAAFDAMLAGLQQHGGIAIVVNTGPSSSRRQAGSGICGIRTSVTNACDPNRNFDARSPLFTKAFLEQWKPGRPVIALHTNGDGFGGDGQGGRGDITMLDAQAFARGEMRARSDGFFGIASTPPLNDPDVYAIIPYQAASAISAADLACRGQLNAKGINVWHERVARSDGSLSNFVAINRPEIAYVNFEAERAADLSTGAKAQRLMIDAYLAQCSALWNEPMPLPAPDR